MDRKRVALYGVGAVLGLAVLGTLASLLMTPDATTSDAEELFDAPRAGDGATCFRTDTGGDEFVTSVDARDPNHTVRYFRNRYRVTRTDHYEANDTTVTVSNFRGDRARSQYRSTLNLLEGEENTTVVADDDDLRIRAVEREDSGGLRSGGGSLLLLPILETLEWERINATAYRPVGGFVQRDGPDGSNRTSYVDWARGVVRTDGDGSIRRVNLTYGVVPRVSRLYEVLSRDPTRVRVTFERSVCRAGPVTPPDGT